MTARMLMTSALLLAAPIGLHAQDHWESQARNEMRRVVNFASSKGYALTGQYYKGTLNEGRYQDVTVSLSDSRQQLLVAVCDVDCGDIDLTLVENDGREVATDRDGSDIAVVTVPSGHPGQHRVRVTMAQCSAAPCRFEVGVFSR